MHVFSLSFKLSKSRTFLNLLIFSTDTVIVRRKERNTDFSPRIPINFHAQMQPFNCYSSKQCELKLCFNIHHLKNHLLQGISGIRNINKREEAWRSTKVIIPLIVLFHTERNVKTTWLSVINRTALKCFTGAFILMNGLSSYNKLVQHVKQLPRVLFHNI